MANGQYPKGIEYRADGRWQLRLQVNNVPATHSWYAAENTENLKRAKKLLKQARENLHEGIDPWPDTFGKYSSEDNPSFRDVAVMACEWTKKTNSFETWTDRVNAMNNVFLAMFHDRPIQNITSKHIKRALNQHDWASENRKKNMVSHLRQVFHYASEVMEYIEVNPVPQVVLSKQAKGKKQPPRVYTRPERTALFQAMEELLTLPKAELEALTIGQRGGIPFTCIQQAIWFYSLAFETALRTSENLALEWSDFDMKKGTVHICKARVKGKLHDRTKTGFVRTVILSPAALAILKSMPRPIAGGPVWTNTQGGPLRDTDKIRAIWRASFERCGVAPGKAYNTRHTRQTELVNAGVSMLLVAQQGGHTVATLSAKYVGQIVTGQETKQINDASEMVEKWAALDLEKELQETESPWGRDD